MTVCAHEKGSRLGGEDLNIGNIGDIKTKSLFALSLSSFLHYFTECYQREVIYICIICVQESKIHVFNLLAHHDQQKIPYSLIITHIYMNYDKLAF